MLVSDLRPLGLTELGQALAAVDPAALLVPPRILRRIIKRDRGLGGIGLQVPHRKSYVVSRERLLRFADRDELGLAADAELPATLILLVRPDPDRLTEFPRGQTLTHYWRLLFHCRVHQAVARRCADGKIGPADLRRRIHEIGLAEFEEIRRVLRQEKFLLPPTDPRTVYEEFAAIYLEIRFFSPPLIGRYFPGLADPDAVDAVLREDVDAAGLFEQTRLPGAPDPVPAENPAVVPEEEAEAEASAAPPAADPATESHSNWLLARADRAEAVGNVVRAAVLKERAAQVSPGRNGHMKAAANAGLDRLVGRLQAALELGPAEADQWRRALAPLLEWSARGLWPAETRLLYDLQKVCVDHERGIYAVDLMEWALSLGRRPIKRPLPSQREVMILKHLRKAARRLPRLRIAQADRCRLAALLDAAVHHGEERLRRRFRPRIREVLDQAGMRPANLPERIALNKLVEELLDRITERGFLNIGDLRDAVSRNQLKLPDLAGPGEFFRGDRLLRIDRGFADALDGVYRRGEIYMRGLQRLSALAFGTRVGRFLTRYLALPFLGAYVVLEGLQHTVVHAVNKFVLHAPKHTPGHVELVSPLSVALFGVFLLGLFYVPPFRNLVGAGFRLAFRGLRAVFFDLPAAFLRLGLMRALLTSRPVAFFFGYLFAPLVCAALAAGPLVLAGCPPAATAGGSAAVFLLALLLFNSRAGRNLEEALGDWLIRSWNHIRTGVLLGLFYLIIDVFKRLMEFIERLLYTVDEWLRFKSGEGRLSLAVKAVVGVFWFFVTYLIRFCFNLLIEPQINPIKHFPVVTVSHKLILPLAITTNKAVPSPLAGLFMEVLPLSAESANAIAMTIVWGIPGIFGFLVWELKENWKLYEANRAPALGPLAIGHHSETMLRLLRPGFHSGTLPKLFARLRKAQRRAERTGKGRAWKAVHKYLEALHHVEKSVRHFIDRELIQLLRQSRGWGMEGVRIGDIHLGSNRIRVDLSCPPLGAEDLAITFTEQAGWLVAGIARRGWLPRLESEPRHALRTALAGLYKMAGVRLIGEEIEALLGPEPMPFDVAPEGLIVWPGGDYHTEAVYDLAATGPARPRTIAGPAALGLPALDMARLDYRNLPLTWDEWVRAWQQDQAGAGRPDDVLPGVQLFPKKSLVAAL